MIEHASSQVVLNQHQQRVSVIDDGVEVGERSADCPIYRAALSGVPRIIAGPLCMPVAA
jgi:hypothetical protein